MSGDNNSAVLNVQSQCDGVMVPDDHERRGDGLGGGLAVAADIPRFVPVRSKFGNFIAKVIYISCKLHTYYSSVVTASVAI